MNFKTDQYLRQLLQNNKLHGKSRLNRFTLINTHTMLVLLTAVATIAIVRFYPQVIGYFSAIANRR